MSAAPLVIAHGGANDVATMAEAARWADVVEADVHLRGGRLEVRHAKSLGPVPVLWERWYLVPMRRPPLVLGGVLAAVPPGVGLLVDLKGLDPRLPAALLRAADRWLAERPLVVSARVWRHLRPLAGRPGIRTLHSVGTPRGLRALLGRRGPRRLDGVAVQRRLLTPEVAAALRARAPELWTWPVDDPADARVLERWGVTGLISDRPAALRAG